MKVSDCGRFVILAPVYIDRPVAEAIESWGERNGLGVQDAVQVALISFFELERFRLIPTTRDQSPSREPRGRE